MSRKPISPGDVYEGDDGRRVVYSIDRKSKTMSVCHFENKKLTIQQLPLKDLDITLSGQQDYTPAAGDIVRLNGLAVPKLRIESVNIKDRTATVSWPSLQKGKVEMQSADFPFAALVKA